MQFEISTRNVCFCQLVKERDLVIDCHFCHVKRKIFNIILFGKLIHNCQEFLTDFFSLYNFVVNSNLAALKCSAFNCIYS